jgi:ribosomal protein S14
MKKEKLVISKDLIKRKSFLKNEIKIRLLKSISKNFQINNLIRVEMFRKISTFWKKCNITKQNNICLYTGRIGGVFKKWNASRHYIKQMGKWNLLTNTKIKSK